ncbi:MAG: zinc-dependent alcohol dehydrogenase family protein [Firmicutes bacterium]|nr:zinc-dependent alcohol dehydrogenase family protein [Bacillota bacterium]
MRGWLLEPSGGGVALRFREELPEPHAGPGEVRLRVSACGVCRTDLHELDGELPPPRPVVPGHQVVGRIDEVGEGVEGLHPGMRVGLPWLWSACGRCDYCRRGQENLCESPRFTGLDVDGGYAEWTVAPAEAVLPLPEIYDDVEAAPLLCAGLIGYRSLRLSGVEPGGRLGLYGFGASAHLTLQVARRLGMEVYVFSRSEAHRRLALELGARWAGAAGEEPPHPLDGAITFAPAGDLLPLALASLRRGGTLAINAVHMDRLPEMSYGLLYHERSLKSVANLTREDGRRFLAIAGAARLEVRARPYPLERAPEALEAVRRSAVEGGAVLVV